jgi:hypothetical protein
MPDVITIERAWGMDKHGNDVPVGFDIFVNGQWGNRFRTKRECMVALAQNGITYNTTTRRCTKNSA